MKEKVKEKIEFRYYETPQGFPLIALMGDKWVVPYGSDPMHFHNYLEIGVCRYGEGTMYLGNSKVPYCEGTITVIPKNFPHHTCGVNSDPQKWEYLFADTDSFLKEIYAENPHFAINLLKRLHSRMFLVNGQEYPELASVLNLIFEEMENENEFYKETVKSLLHAALLKIIELNKQEKVPEKFELQNMNFGSIAEALRYIEQNFAEEIRIGELARICNLSETHFRRIFDEYMNVSPVEYINLVRIEKACELMGKSDERIQDIGAKVGFPVNTTFSRNFKNVTGMSPLQWKKKLKEDKNLLLDCKVPVLKGW
ncbi:MAG: AraC family transcriptional regulator [Lachnospiraceae bacterium]|nr:AraC family transcriptional regulator [Lachnospiraceae bacterium]